MHCDYLTLEITLIDLIAYHTPWWRQIKSETFQHTILIDIYLLTSNGLVIKSRYYDFNDNICIVIISL